ncbi:MAG TPA: hypothetical protein VI306_09155 [Pyrinomonadaceae bacterium]
MSESSRMNRLHRLRRPRPGPVIRAIVTVILLAGASQAIIALVVRVAWPRLTAFLHVWWQALIGTLTVLLIGVGLYFFKKYYQRLYGLAEIGFALAVAWSSIMRARSTSDAASWLATLAAAYLVVRGLSNYEEGFEKHFREKYLKNKFQISD